MDSSPFDGAGTEGTAQPPGSIESKLQGDGTALKLRFDPKSRDIRYQAVFQMRHKRANKGWADFADDLKGLVDKAYPSLQDEAREQLTINAYLQQLLNPQVTFSVKQRRPKTLDDAVATTLEMESYLAGPNLGAASMLQPSEEVAICPVADVDKVDKLIHVVERLAEQVERLQQETHSRRRELVPTPQRPFSGEC